MGMDDSNLLVQCDFEVFGHVQGMEFWDKEKGIFFLWNFIKVFIHFLCILYFVI